MSGPGWSWLSGCRRMRTAAARATCSARRRDLASASRESLRASFRRAPRLADYLEQHGRQTRRLQRIPPSLWESALRHTPSGPAMARFARSCGLLRTAFQLERSAAVSGQDDAARRAGDVLRKAGREKEALPWYQQAGEAGDPEAALWAGQLLWRQSRVPDALHWFRRAAEAGLPEAAAAQARKLLNSNHRARVVDALVGAAERRPPQVRQFPGTR